MTRSDSKDDDSSSKLLADRLIDADARLRALCGIEGLLSTYDEVREYFYGADTYENYSLKDWMQDIHFKSSAGIFTLSFALIAKVIAHIRCSQEEIDRSNLALAKRTIKKIDPLIIGLHNSLADIYLETKGNEQNSAKRGGYIKDINRKCQCILNFLEENDRLEGVDFKTFDEATNYAIEVMIDIEGIDDQRIIDELRRFYPAIFKRWLSAYEDKANSFEKYTHISIDE